MKIPTISVLSVFALLGMALAMDGYGYGGYGYGAGASYGGGSYGPSYVPVPVYGHGGAGAGVGGQGFCKFCFTFIGIAHNTRLRKCVIKIVTLKGGHLLWYKWFFIP